MADDNGALDATPRENAPDIFAAAPEPADDLRERLGAIIRNGFSNGPISRSETTWEHLQTRLGDVVDAILKEI